MEIEKEVILLMSQGDEKAYGIVFRKFYAKIHRFVFMLLKSKDDADDVCQIIFEKIWRKRQKFAEIKDFDSYLFILTKYTVINYISTKRVIPIDIDSLPDQCANVASPHEEFVAKDTQLLIDMIVENMPPPATNHLPYEPGAVFQERRDSQTVGVAEENRRESSQPGS